MCRGPGVPPPSHLGGAGWCQWAPTNVHTTVKAPLLLLAENKSCAIIKPFQLHRWNNSFLFFFFFYLQSIVVFSCDGLTRHLRQNLLARAGNGIHRIQHWSHDRGKLQQSQKEKKKKELLLSFWAHLWSMDKQVWLDRDGDLHQPRHPHKPIFAGLHQSQKQAHLLQLCSSTACSCCNISWRHLTPEYLPCKFAAYYINYTVNE